MERYGFGSRTYRAADFGGPLRHQESSFNASFGWVTMVACVVVLGLYTAFAPSGGREGPPELPACFVCPRGGGALGPGSAFDGAGRWLGGSGAGTAGNRHVATAAAGQAAAQGDALVHVAVFSSCERAVVRAAVRATWGKELLQVS
jgi:hypothetical protein